MGNQVSSDVELLRDKWNRSVQAVTPSTSAANDSIGAASVRVALPASTELIRVAATGDVYIKFGNSGVEATSSDAIFPTGVEVFRVPSAATHMAFIQVGSSTGVCGVHKVT